MHTAAIFVLLSCACEHSLSFWGEGTRVELSVFSQLLLDSGAECHVAWESIRKRKRKKYIFNPAIFLCFTITVLFSAKTTKYT